MDRLEALIKRLQEAKEELEKNVNQSYSATPNMTKEEMDKASIIKPAQIARPDKGFGAIIDKTPKPPMLKDEAMMMGEGCEMKDMKTHANGQWSMKKGAFKELEHKLEGEGKSEESAGAIAYSVGKEKYGKKGMEAKAKAGEAKKSDEDGAC